MKKEVCIPSSLSFKNFYALLKSKIKISHFLITLPFLLLSFSFLPSKAFCAPSFEEQLEQTSKGISSIRTLTGNKKLAVMGFQDLVNLKGRSSNVSTIIEQDLSNLLINDMPGKIIAKSHIETVLKELQISSQDVFDPENRKRFGKLAAADYIVTGTYWAYGGYININIVVVEIESGLGVFSSRVRVSQKDFVNFSNF